LEDKKGKTLRLILILLYGTGATVEEVLSLRVSDVNMRRHEVNFEPTASRHGRKIPIHPSLSACIACYLDEAPHVVTRKEKDALLRMPDGKPLSRKNLGARFRRLLSIAGIKQGPNGNRPYLHDLRYAFAVHHLKRWIETKRDLNILIPLLSAYMGYTSLMEAERFLAFTPERFRDDLEKLCPNRNGGDWKIKEDLLAFLTTL
jgi:site-specific recombinase XerD